MDPSELQPGHRLDRYELLCPLAYGGMASVWLARFGGRLGFERLVVVKMILPQFSQDPRFQQMFLDEARIASKIEHSNVARILDVGEQYGNYFIVMEWVDGDSLSKVMKAAEARRELVPAGVVLRIAADAASGLYAAHELKERDGTHLAVVHRDVSPQNILVANSGATMLIDFGVAKARDRIAQDTTAGQLKGKIRYMAPEQALGKALDHRADVWAMGAILYELFSGGKPPYQGPNEVATLHLLTTGQPRPPLPEGTPPAAREIIDRAMAYAPGDRFASALELNVALESAIVAIEQPTTAAMVAQYTAELLTERKAARKRAVDKALDLAHRRDAVPPAPASSSQSVASVSLASSPSSGSGTAQMHVSFSSHTGPPIIRPAHSSGLIPTIQTGPHMPRMAAPVSPHGFRPPFPTPPGDPNAHAHLGEAPSVASHGTMGSAAMEYAQPVYNDGAHDGARRRRYLIAAAVGVSLAVFPMVAVSLLSGAMKHDEGKGGAARPSETTTVVSAASPAGSGASTAAAAVSPGPAAPPSSPSRPTSADADPSANASATTHPSSPHRPAAPAPPPPGAAPRPKPAAPTPGPGPARGPIAGSEMRRRVPAALIAIGITTLAVLGPAPRLARAQAPSGADRELARNLMDEGDRKRQVADLKSALVAYVKADEIMHVPTTMIEVARTQAALGQLLEAKETLARLHALPVKPNEPGPFGAARKAGEALSVEVAARTPSLLVMVDGNPSPAPEVLLDGEPLPPGPGTPRKVNPGRHAIVSRAQTGERHQDVLVVERENKIVKLDVRDLVSGPAPPAPRGPSSGPPRGGGAAKALVFGGFGLAIVGVGVGAVTGLISLNKTNDLKPRCPNNACPPGSQDEIDSANTIGDVSTIAFIAGGAGAIAGVVGVVLAIRSSEPARTTGTTWRPVLGASYAGVAGTF